MNQNEIFSPLHKWEIGPIATHVLELIFHTAKMIQSFHYTFGKSRQFGPMFQYFRYRYLNCHFLSVTHRKNRDRPMIETLWQNQGVPAGVCVCRVGIRQNIYTSGFFRTQKFTPKVRDSRQIQCYQKCVIRDKFNTKKNKKHPLC